MTDTMAQSKAWDRLPTETDKQFAAFQAYCQLSPYGEGDERRNITNLAKKLKLSATARLAAWSSANSWKERVLAYDNHLANTSIAVIETALGDYQQSVIDVLSAQLIVLNRIIERKLKNIYESIGTDEEPDMSAVKKLAETIRMKDDLARRIGRMPTQFTTDKGEDIDPEQKVYTIGG